STPDRLGLLFIKRLFDFVSSVIALIFLMPLLILVAIVIKASSPGPVFFKQQRCSLYGRKFMFYKFRTMVDEAESMLEAVLPYNEMSGPVFKMTNDPRVTEAGKWLRKYSIDELPQLWNVVNGDMSLVGPRPPLPEEVEKYDGWQRRRLSMRPGITCLWQIKGRNKIADFNEWMRLDMEYIDNWSLWLDFKILFKSVPVVLSGAGAK
ncbi:MAG: sugar transferase, partial [Nitrospirae bacterium]|nr:sugar transferase [Nitrospirota bacterium]